MSTLTTKDGIFLIDTLDNTDEVKTILEPGFKKLGLKMEDIKYVMMTHGLPDHWGGAKYIQALKAPLPHVQLIPTGGVNLDTIGDFLRAGSFAVGVGSELIDSKSIAYGKYDLITERACKFREAVAAARTPQ